MRIFASEVTEESKSATDRVKKLGTQHTNTHIISLKKLFAKKIIIIAKFQKNMFWKKTIESLTKTNQDDLRK